MHTMSWCAMKQLTHFCKLWQPVHLLKHVRSRSFFRVSQNTGVVLVQQTSRTLLAWQLRPVSDRCKERCGLALAASWFTVLTLQSDCDKVDFDTLVKNKILDPELEQTGWERLTAMYTLDETGGLTPELQMVSDISVAGLLIGGCLGAMLNGRLALVKFLERNQATAFETPMAAKRALQDRIFLGMFRGFFMFGWRTALFTSSFSLVTMTLMVYTNEISTLHFAGAGLVSGALYKVTMGLRGMTAGAVAGSLLGLIGGGCFSLACYLSDITLPKLRCQQYIWKHQQHLREQARAARKREKLRLAVEKKAEETKKEIIAESMSTGRFQAVASPSEAGGSAETSPGAGSQPEAPSGGSGSGTGSGSGSCSGSGSGSTSDSGGVSGGSTAESASTTSPT